MVIGNIPVWRRGLTVIIIHCTFSKAIVGLIEEYSLSGECLERLDLGLNNGWVSFRASFIKLFFLFRFHRKKNPKKVLTGAEACVSLEHPSYNCRPS